MSELSWHAGLLTGRSPALLLLPQTVLFKLCRLAACQLQEGPVSTLPSGAGCLRLSHGLTCPSVVCDSG